MAFWKDLVIEFSKLDTNEATKRAEKFSVEEIEVLEQQETLVSLFREQIPIIYSSLQASGARKWPRILYSILGTKSWDSNSSIWVRDELVLESIKPLLASLNPVDILQHIEGELFTILEQFSGSEFRPKRYYPESIIKLVDECLVEIAEHYLIIDEQPPPTRLMNLQTIIRFVLPITLNRLPSLSILTQSHAHYLDLVDRLDAREPKQYGDDPVFVKLVAQCIDLIDKNGAVPIRELLKELTNSLDGDDVRIVLHILMAFSYQLDQPEEKQLRFAYFVQLMREFLDYINRLRGLGEVYVEALKFHYYIVYKFLIKRESRFYMNRLPREDIEMACKDILSYKESKLICCGAFNLIKCIGRFRRELLTEEEKNEITRVALTTDACRAYDARWWLANHRRIPGDWSVCFSKIVDRFVVYVDRFKTRYLNKEQDNYLNQLADMFDLTGLIISLRGDNMREALTDFERLFGSVGSFLELYTSHPELEISGWILNAFSCFMNLLTQYAPRDISEVWLTKLKNEEQYSRYRFRLSRSRDYMYLHIDPGYEDINSMRHVYYD